MAAILSPESHWALRMRQGREEAASLCLPSSLWIMKPREAWLPITAVQGRKALGREGTDAGNQACRQELSSEEMGPGACSLRLVPSSRTEQPSVFYKIKINLLKLLRSS